MRTHRHLYSRVIHPRNLWAAYLDARRGKRRRPPVAAFALYEEEALEDLHAALVSGRWRPRGYRVKVISEPKKRLISAAPFSDRVVHHAIHRVLAPVLTKRFIADSYACLPGRGTHRAILQFQQGLRRHPWMARMDIERYFLEVDWDVLLGVIGRTVRDRRLMALLERVLASGEGLYARPDVLDALGLVGRYVPRSQKGLPIGNLTSQLFANVYLDGLDHYAKRELKVPAFCRYMGDIVLFGPSRAVVRRWAQACESWLGSERLLTVQPGCDRVMETGQTFRFLGYTVTRRTRRISGRTLRRMRARLRATVQGGVSRGL